jgi:polyisoprenoid-binding protein YceI
MPGLTRRQTPTRNDEARSPCKHPWRRRIVLGVVLVLVVVIGAVAAYLKLQPTPSPLVLPTTGVSAPAGVLGGTWDVTAGSVAGFRLQETFIGLGNDVVGRTNDVTGTISVSDNRVISATLHIDLTTIKVGGKTEPQLATSFDTRKYPNATFNLSRPVMLSSTFASGATITETATGRLAMHGVSREVTVAVTARRNGAALQVVGTIPIAFSDWAIKEPGGFGFLGSLANHGVAEFLLVLNRH